MTDSRFAALELLDNVTTLPRARVITRLRLDAALYDPAPLRHPGTTGRPRLKGQHRPTLAAVLADERTPWTALIVDQWYGGGPREVEVATDTAVWYHAGKPPVAIRWVLIRDPKKESLNLLEFVGGRSWCTCERVGIDEARLFARDWL